MASATVHFTHGRSALQVAYYTDGQVIGQPGAMDFDDSEIWTLEKIEKDLAQAYPGQTIVIIAID